jgi:hypothetical protein
VPLAHLPKGPWRLAKLRQRVEHAPGAEDVAVVRRGRGGDDDDDDEVDVACGSRDTDAVFVPLPSRLDGAMKQPARRTDRPTIDKLRRDNHRECRSLPDNVHLLVPAARNRTVATGERLFEQCTDWSKVARYTITVPAKRGGAKEQRAERTTVVAVRFGEVVVRRPSGTDKTLPPELPLRVVDVREVDPPEDSQRCIHWCLLTTHAVQTAAEEMKVVRWYRLR